MSKQLHISPFVEQAEPNLVRLGIHSSAADLKYKYNDILTDIEELRRKRKGEDLELIRYIAESDFWFFYWFIIQQKKKSLLEHPFIYSACQEIDREENYTMYMWARGHWKSSLRTHAKTIHRLIQDPTRRVGIFSCTRDLAKTHLREMKGWLESNPLLPKLWPHIFYENPKRQALKWSELDGLYLKGNNLKEPSVGAYGLVDHMPTGCHFSDLLFDDLVDPNNTNTDSQIEKVKDSFSMADNLGDTTEESWFTVLGTRYHFNDLYSDLIKTGKWKVSERASEVDPETGKGLKGGIPVLLPAAMLQDKFDKQGEYIYSSQNLLNPVAESRQGFKRSWIVKPLSRPELKDMNLYVICDPANSKTKRTDYTVMVTIGLDALHNYWLVDIVRDRLNLMERWIKLKELVYKYQPMDVAYERIGMQSDIDFFNIKMDEEAVYFKITEVGGITAKVERIKRLVPLFQNQKFMLPHSLLYENYEGKTQDLIEIFLEEEFNKFPYSQHDDILDAMSRIFDITLTFPAVKAVQTEKKKFKWGNPFEEESAEYSWMAV